MDRSAPLRPNNPPFAAIFPTNYNPGAGSLVQNLEVITIWTSADDHIIVIRHIEHAESAAREQVFAMGFISDVRTRLGAE